ncbi:acetyl-CoA synthetase-like protein [Dendrothele bispora CBS 962.96]|uniref:Acetyl-CoA synthetase-like protein n=1 Tax=Dendrothele bispora (strain CBS 962.96) TaxID=1314807 RepID=A0A4S8MCY4_DENBC|nr:acetyl-CoA synthetase-like protein [Dendrothele bispora CBS 962.96]
MTQTQTEWKPKRTNDEVEKILTAPGSLHELETVFIDGLVQRVYKNLWPSTRIFWFSILEQHGDKTCTVSEDRRYTFKEIHQRAIKAASIYRDIYGVKKGDRVAICSRNYPDYFTFFWATQMIGAVSVLINAWLPQDQLFHCIAKTECIFVLIDPERADRLISVIPNLKSKGVAAFAVIENFSKRSWLGVDDWKTIWDNYRGDVNRIMTEDPNILPEDNATIIFTSGTSGMPKGVLSSHRAFLTVTLNALAGRGRTMLREGEELSFAPAPGPPGGIILATPLFHVTGTSLMLLCAVAGQKIVLMRKWDIKEAVRLMKAENITAFGGVPTTISDLADSAAAGHPLEAVMYGGAPTSVPLALRARKAFPNALMSQAYGMTETNALAVGFNGHDYEMRWKSCGRAMPINDVIIMLDGKQCPTGTPGEVWMRGPNIMKGYWGDPEATAKALTKDGWCKSGDIGYLDEEGFLFINGRLKDMIIRGGENVDPVSVENIIHRDERVMEAAAVGVPDERLGELVTVLVTIKPAYKDQVKEEELIALAEQHLPKFAVPVMIMIYEDEFEHTPSEKIIKAPLRKIAGEEWKRRQVAKPVKAKL